MTAVGCALTLTAGLALIVTLWKRWGLIGADNDKSASMVKGSPEARQPYWEVRHANQIHQA
ncbi:MULTISPECIES: hypothetical protein [unclassified Rhodococcus (in: high G+C Gram-positive bacteria)]|uniref:hypothetical protein n=1 Tax=unclassified Rhodococcus (in: high G+C Gram-positive bacteria) TaxID=192944 RepID=UPI0006F6D7D1|nr:MULTISPECIES: hypothetical protein [unclassified Rhodococcus (in: high G+C Gram-positive bacteria)]KQU30323.1 hypothetical protein ASG69_04500 [Rhodococcus sp. Leaf225]KQU44772.1 hypothetical protein ASH03_12640 [Rhodococcus sp. Leaf258]